MTKRKPEPWRNRIVGYADVAASDLSANPLNARLHPAAQRAALTAVLDDVGFVAPVIVNKRTGLIVDGHLRVEEASARWLGQRGLDRVPSHIWLGVSVENQEWADKRIPVLVDLPVDVRFLSCEPLVGPVDLSPWIDSLQWVIVGGESGNGTKNFRPMPHEWARSVRDLCVSADVPFFFKQSAAYRTELGITLDDVLWEQWPAQHPRERAALGQRVLVS